MSAGHGHKRPNLKHPAELKKLLAEGDAPALMQRWQGIDVDHDMPDLAGYNVAGTVRYIDKDIFRALLDPDYATEILGEPIDTGLSPEDTVDCLMKHEGVEKVILDAANNVDSYEGAHEFATVAENEEVTAKGGTPLRYERGLQKAIAYCAKKPPNSVPKDLACAPFLDDPDANDKRILKLLQAAGCMDAYKISKKSVDYARSTGADRCAGCAHWQDDRRADLSRCALVDGLVRTDRWCNRYDAMEGGASLEQRARNAQGADTPT